MSYIDDIVYENPAFASSYIAGKTFENRNIKTVVLKTNTSTRGIFIDCGMHSVFFFTFAFKFGISADCLF